MTATHEDIDYQSLTVGDLWELYNNLTHDIRDMRHDVHWLEQQIAQSLSERRKIVEAIEEQVGDIDWGPHEND